MVVAGIVRLKCPSCQWTFEAAPPDNQHSFASTKEPAINRINGDAIKKDQRCRNPKCQKQFSVYWFDFKMHLDRV